MWRLTLMTAVACGAIPIAAAERPNIIIILADDLGDQSIGAYGGRFFRRDDFSAPIRTPNIDTLSAEGMRFERAFATPVCSPSRAQLLTGKYAYRVGFPDIAGRNGAVDSLDPEKHTTLARALKDAGYVTALAGKWHLGQRAPPVGPDAEETDSKHITACGFDRQFNTLGAYMRDYGSPKPGEYAPDRIQSWVLRFLDSRKDRPEPFFLYYASPLAHTPLKPTPLNPDGPAEGIENFPFIIEYLDRQVGEVMAKLDELGMRENTLVLFSGDNGTHGFSSVMADGSVMVAGKATMKDSGSRVPLIANWRGVIEPARVSRRLVDFTDIMPTCLDLTGVPAPEGLDGVSFAPRLRGQRGTPREWVHVLMVDEYFVRDEWLKLREDGTLYDVRIPSRRETPIPPDRMSTRVIAAKQKLEAVARRLHPNGWPPDSPVEPVETTD
jgi:arylsulfatase A-like enzyme